MFIGVRWDVHHLEQTGSTNADLLGLARGGASPGTVVRADYQTEGRGRLNRTWEASPGSSLLASILLPAEPVAFLAVARVALAAADACLDLAAVEPALKWPNDLMVGDRKLAGLLAAADGASPTMVVGIGCNVSRPPDGGRPVGLVDQVAWLSDLTASPPEPAELLDGLLARLGHWLEAPPDQVLTGYRNCCSTLGRRVRVDLAERSFDGTATGLTSWGALEVATGTVTEVVSHGDVVHVRAR